jgi:ferredoxin-type protein NapF
MRPGTSTVHNMTTINIARRAFFLSGNGNELAHHVPWAVDGFEAVCTCCGDCIDACEKALIKRGDGGFPTLDFRHGGCTFCGACAAACQPDALDRSLTPAWRLKAVINDACMSLRGITCRTCDEACDAQAIRFRLQIGGRASPEINQAGCTGCGECVAVCPSAAITIEAAA